MSIGLIPRFASLNARSSSLLWLAILLAVVGSLWACGSSDDDPTALRACTVGGMPLRIGYFAHFPPISYTDDAGAHAGYEADLLSALELIDGANLRFERVPVDAWDDVWLRSANEFDIVGGGITILDERTRDHSGREVVRFTRGHVAFRQTLLTRASDAGWLPGYDGLARDFRVGVFAGTTGEARLLELTGLADDDGILAAGARVLTPSGEQLADGARHFITAAEHSPQFDGRTMLLPPDSRAGPTLVYVNDVASESELLAMLADGTIDGIARDGLENADAAVESGGALAVPLGDDDVEWGGFTVAAAADDFRACLNEHLDYLTDTRSIGYGEWREDPSVFANRARAR